MAKKAKNKSAILTDISHPDKILFPPDITKAALAQFYIEITDWILPHVASRPLTVVRCPEGIEGECFFQKHVNETFAKGLVDAKIPGATQPYLMINNQAGLVALIQMAVIEIHPWGSLADKPDKPDRLIFDLDPAEGISWKQLRETALLLRKFFQHLGLESFVKTTGGKGLHIVVPIARRLGWNDITDFCHAIADKMVELNPDLYIANMSKAKREGKIFIDYLRNAQGATAIAPYCVRARKGAPVATPLNWEELPEIKSSTQFTFYNLPARLKKLRNDPWEQIFEVKQGITKDMQQKLGLIR